VLVSGAPRNAESIVAEVLCDLSKAVMAPARRPIKSGATEFGKIRNEPDESNHECDLVASGLGSGLPD
jgi:hypothetical protein